MAKGTLKEHIKNMICKVYLWTSQMTPENFIKAFKNDICLSYDELKFERTSNSETQCTYELTIDFGDIQVSYELTFKLSSTTHRWVLMNIQS